jgi:hypothetical protein
MGELKQAGYQRLRCIVDNLSNDKLCKLFSRNQGSISPKAKLNCDKLIKLTLMFTKLPKTTLIV